MRFFLTLLFLFPSSFSWCAGSSNNIHAVLVGDTSSDLNVIIKRDIAHIRTILNMIAQKTNMRLITKTLTGSKVTVKNVHRLVDSLAKNQGISFFYFSGHGFRLPKDPSPWPRLTLMKQQDSIDADKIATILENDNARLTLAIFDCCNEFFIDKSSNHVLKKPIEKPKISWETTQTLFVKTKGLIIMAAATPGDVARGNNKGSFFTTSFLESLTSPSKAEIISWEKLFKDINRKCSFIDQHPICMISITQQ